MKSIRITTENRDRIQAALDSVQRRCRVGLLSADMVIEMAAEAEAVLDELRVSKKRRVGVQKHNGIPDPTRVVIRRGRSGWSLVQVKRVRPLSGDAPAMWLQREAV